MAPRASGSTVDLRAASETNSKPWSEPWMSHLRQILVTLRVANNDTQAGPSTHTRPVNSEDISIRDTRRLSVAIAPGKGVCSTKRYTDSSLF